MIDQESTPARSSMIPRLIGAVVATNVAPQAGETEPGILRGPTGALNDLEKEVELLFLSLTVQVMVIVFSIPKSKRAPLAMVRE